MSSRTQKPEPMTRNPYCRCDNCGNGELWNSLHDITDIGQRLNAGSVVPAGECSVCGALSYVVTSTVTAQDIPSWLDCIWTALHGFREECIPEGDKDYDAQWDEICTSMAWITEGLGSDANDIQLRLIHFAEATLDRMESTEDWDSDMTSEIGNCAHTLGLAKDDGENLFKRTYR